MPFLDFHLDGGALTLDRQRVFSPHLEEDLNILHISDVHLSEGDEPYLDELQGLIKNISDPIDLITLGGDYVNDISGFDLIEAFCDILPPVPKVAVLGNHDFYQNGIKGPLGIFFVLTRLNRIQALPTQKLRDSFKHKDVFLLEHDSLELKLRNQSVFIFGSEQPKRGRVHQRPMGPTTFMDSNCFKVLLVHRPDMPDAFSHSFDLLLGGHTHGGQIQIPGIGALRTNCKISPRTPAGLHLQGTCQWYVNHGFNADVDSRVRLNTPRQISLLELRPGNIPKLPHLKMSFDPRRPLKVKCDE